ncbi:MAG: hypothetical protein WC229_03135 [Candidatus Paceibacterota bacterium]|jgi:hypothetical protein
MNEFNGYMLVTLDNESIDFLKENIKSVHNKIYYHHMTVAYKPDDVVYKKYEGYIGKRIELEIIGFCFDEKGQAAVVKTNLSENEAPHITLSCREDAEPFYSNTLVKNRTNFQELNLKVTGIFQIESFKNN